MGASGRSTASCAHDRLSLSDDIRRTFAGSGCLVYLVPAGIQRYADTRLPMAYFHHHRLLHLEKGKPASLSNFQRCEKTRYYAVNRISTSASLLDTQKQKRERSECLKKTAAGQRVSTLSDHEKCGKRCSFFVRSICVSSILYILSPLPPVGR